MKTITKVQIISYSGDVPLKVILQKMCLLRSVSKIGDIEVVNNTQLGRLRDNQISFKIISQCH